LEIGQRHRRKHLLGRQRGERHAGVQHEQQRRRVFAAAAADGHNRDAAHQTVKHLPTTLGHRARHLVAHTQLAHGRFGDGPRTSNLRIDPG
jgi:hypothetical protein